MFFNYTPTLTQPAIFVNPFFAGFFHELRPRVSYGSAHGQYSTNAGNPGFDPGYSLP